MEKTKAFNNELKEVYFQMFPADSRRSNTQITTDLMH